MDNRNLILAIVLSAVIIITFHLLAPPPRHVSAPDEPAVTAEPDGGAGPAGAARSAVPPEPVPAPVATLDREQILAGQKKVLIDTARLKGSIDLRGAGIDDLTLTDYHASVDPASPAIVLLSPFGAPQAYVSEQGWLAVGADVKVPDGDTEWQADGERLSVGAPVTLSWNNGAGLTFKRVISVDENYMFTVVQSVTNDGPVPVSLRPYASVARTGTPPNSANWLSYEGPIAVLNGAEADFPYDGLTGPPLESCTSTRGFFFIPVTHANPVSCDSAGGWLGFGDKYWLTAVAPADQSRVMTASIRHSGSGTEQKYQIDYLGTELAVSPGATVSDTTLVFAGPKQVSLLARYRDGLGLPRFENAVDFGTFWFITKPIFFLLDWIYAVVGNFGTAILVLTVLIKGLFFPLQTRAVISMNKMKALQPEILKLREKYKDDALRLNQETMALQKRMGANPLLGCLPVFVQIPVFFSLYKVLYVTIEMRHAPFYGWIHDLSAPDPTSIWTLFGAIPWTPPHFLPVIGLWPVIYCATMMLQQRMQPIAPDPVQARMLQFMPLIFTFMLGNFPAGLVMYWSWNNTLTMLQQYVITRHMAVAKPARP